MKKRILKLFLLIIVPAMVLFSCKKDDFSEKDALDAQQSVDLAITVLDGSTSQIPVQGATVKVLVDSVLVSKTTNASGSVVFTNLKIGGDVPVNVTKEGYTSVMTSLETSPSTYRQTQVSGTITIYSLANEKLATFKGRLTLQSDLTDRDREPAAGVVVKVRNTSISSTETFFTATTDDNGNYTLSVPVSSNNSSITLYYPEFTVNQKLAVTQQDGSKAVIERLVRYRSGSTGLDVTSIPSAYATVAAPPAATGTGFSLGVKANRMPLNNSSAFLVNGGAGYNGGVTLLGALIPFSNDPSGNHADLEVNIVDGKITEIIQIIPNTAQYSTAPTLNLNTFSPTTPANIILFFSTTYNIYVANGGSNYNQFPRVAVETENWNTGIRVKSIDSNVDDNANNILGFGNAILLSENLGILNGVIKSIANDGDTIATTTTFSSAPVFSSSLVNNKRAVLNAPSVADSTLSSISVFNGGSGYDRTNPPVVTLTTLAGYGSGAVAKATVNANGAVDAIYIINPGKGYVQNVNDFRKTGSTTTVSQNSDNPTVDFNVRPGDVITQDVHYGTGYQVLNQTTGK
ncbi:MAG TPA: hypothetical protein VHO50_13905 [Bacteroidales bacterium]|nr:hypothetical protein [Bacteroidales bacterium]